MPRCQGFTFSQPANKGAARINQRQRGERSEGMALMFEKFFHFRDQFALGGVAGVTVVHR